MDRAAVAEITWTAEAFLEGDQQAFGDAWRYELVAGRIVAHDAPSPEHGAITSRLVSALGARLRGHTDGCRPEVEAIGGPDAVLRLGTIGVEIGLAEIYQFAAQVNKQALLF